MDFNKKRILDYARNNGGVVTIKEASKAIRDSYLNPTLARIAASGMLYRMFLKGTAKRIGLGKYKITYFSD